MFEQMENLILANNLSTYLYILACGPNPGNLMLKEKFWNNCSNSIENVLFIYLLFWIGLFEGDILIDQETKNYLLGGKIMSRDAVISPIFYWPRGILYYTFDPKLGEF